jgi:hypothetical protein
MKRTALSILLGLVLAAAVSPLVSYAAGCYAVLLIADPETGEPVSCYRITNEPPCRYRCPWGDVYGGN